MYYYFNFNFVILLLKQRIDTRIRLLHFCIFNNTKRFLLLFFQLQNLFTFYISIWISALSFFLIYYWLGSFGKNIKAALLFLFLYLLLPRFLCYFLYYFLFLEKNEFIIYFLTNMELSETANKIFCVHFLSFCCETCDTAIAFMADWSTCLKRQLLVLYYYHGIAFKTRTLLDILQYYQLMFGSVHFIYAI